MAKMLTCVVALVLTAIPVFQVEALVLVSRNGRLPFTGSTVIECSDENAPSSIRFQHLDNDGNWRDIDATKPGSRVAVRKQTKVLTLTRDTWLRMEELNGAYRCMTRLETVYTIKLPSRRLHVAASPEKYTVVANKDDTVMLTMNSLHDWATPEGLSYAWKHNGKTRNETSWQAFSVEIEQASEADEGIYTLNIPQYALIYKSYMRLIIRGCPKDKYGPSCSLVCRKCVNGGICHDSIGQCVCPPGFHGPSCEQACGTNTYGSTCQYMCDENELGNPRACEKRLFCMKDPYGCSCYAGFKGLECMEACPPNTFGADCTQQCHCKGGATACNRQTGECSDGCMEGWLGQTCQLLESDIEDVLTPGHQVTTTTKALTTAFQYTLSMMDESSVITNAPVTSTSKPDYSTMTTVIDVVADGVTTGRGQPIENLRLVGSFPTYLNIHWDDTSKNADEIQGYIVSYSIICYRKCKPCAKRGDWKNITLSRSRSGNMTQRLKRLEPYTSYMVTVRTTTRTRTDVPVSIEASTGEKVPIETPGALKLMDVQFKLAVFTWQPPPCTSIRGELKGYRYNLYLTNENVQVRHGTVNVEDMSIVLKNLNTSTSYRFDLSAFNNVGNGPQSSVVFTTKSLEEQDPPLFLKMESNTQTTLLISWEKPKAYTGGLFGYEIHVAVDSSFHPSVSTKKPPMPLKVPDYVTKQTIQDLQAGTLYQVSVQAEYESGLGPSAVKQMWTEIKAPPVPEPPTVLQQTGSTLTLNLPTVDGDAGPINGYYIVVDRVIEMEVQRNKRYSDYKTIPAFNRTTLVGYSKAQKSNLSFYVTAKLSEEHMDSSTEFTVGDDMIYGGFHNIPLEVGSYVIYYGVSSAANNVVKYSFTRMPGKVSLAPSTTASEKSALSMNTIIYTIAAGSAFIIFLVAVIIIVIFRRKRQGRHNISKTEFHEANVPLTAIASSPSVHTHNCEGVFENVEGGFNWQKIIPVSFLPEYLKTMKSNDSYSFVEEFQELTQGLSFSWDSPRHPDNLSKNSCGKIASHDQSRVVLNKIVGEPVSDCIDASYIDGYCKSKAYIATQGPKLETVDDFWRMVWQENCRSIVMLTEPKNGQAKCEQYWPDHYNTYWALEVSHLRTERKPDYTVRSFDVSKGRDSRSITQYQFDLWTDNCTAEFATSLLAFRRRIMADNPPESGPIVVHCSTGVGKTGSFITIDAMLEQAKLEEAIDVFDYVKKISQQRIGMVQTQAQYVFIHDVLAEALVFGDTCYEVKVVAEKFDQLQTQLDPSSGLTLLQEQFKLLDNITFDNYKDCSIGQRNENTSKNRFQLILPSDQNRVVLPDTDDKSDYINATYVSGLKRQDMFVATQCPLKHTVDQFWQMVYVCGSTTIVSLNNWDEDPTLYEYWPLHGDDMFGPFHVETVHWDDLGDISIKTFKVVDVQKDGVDFKEIKQYQVKNWLNATSVPSVDTLLKLLGLVKTWQHKSGNNPIVVHCTNGSDRTGVFCATATLCEQLETSRVVDVFHTCKQLRVFRPQFITCLEQYSFCYQLAVEFVTELC